MNAEHNKSKVIDVFADVDSHRVTAAIIKKHSTNRLDIRDVAIEGLDLSGCREILELGCGFGFFTESLKGKVSPNAHVTGVDIIKGYAPAFKDACNRAGIAGKFIASDVSVIRDFGARFFDLIICSYSLYFFPHIVEEISRILNDHGVLVATVHNSYSMRELVAFARDVLVENSMIDRDSKLHIESVISSFSSDNGYEILKPWFDDIRQKKYENTLVFKPGDIYSLIEYFRFKWPFFLSAVPMQDVARAFDLFEVHFQKYFNLSTDGFIITKDDTVFICSKPIYRKTSS